MQDRNEAAQNIAEVVGDFLDGLIAEGIPAELVLAGAHAQIIAMMTTRLGGPMTASSCERAADRFRHMPSLDALALLSTPPAGRA